MNGFPEREGYDDAFHLGCLGEEASPFHTLSYSYHLRKTPHHPTRLISIFQLERAASLASRPRCCNYK